MIRFCYKDCLKRELGKPLIAIAAALLLSGCFKTLADFPYRDHRFDSFVTLPACDGDDILFVGNSITNMMNWWEAFGSRDNIKSRGNSGATSGELLANFDKIVKGTPAKVFLMIGTNDLASDQPVNHPDSVASRIVEFLSRTRQKLPEAEVFFQSVLPSRVGRRTPEKIQRVNSLVEQWIASTADNKMTYVDIYSSLVDEEDGGLKLTSNIPNGEAISFDGLHLTQQGYKVWLDIIKDYVGYEPVYASNAPNLWGNMNGSEGMRVSYFGALPVKSRDILMFGDEMIHNGEWQERFGSTDVKDRGIGWGFPGMPITSMEGAFADVLFGNVENGVEKETPKAVTLYGGVNEINAGWSADSLFNSFSHAVSTLREMLPKTPVYVMTLLPFPQSEEAKNDEISEFNRLIAGELVNSDNNVYLIDLWTAAGQGNRDETWFMNEKSTYLSGKGYDCVSRVIGSELNP